MIQNKLAVTADTPLLTRRAQHLDSAISQALTSVCAAIPTVNACYVLDAQKPGENDMKVLIGLTLENEAQELDGVAKQFQDALRQFPQFAENVFITSSSQPLFAKYLGHEFYRKSIPR